MPLMFRAESSLGRPAALAEAARFAAYAGLQDKLGERADRLTLQQRKAVEFARALAAGRGCSWSTRWRPASHPPRYGSFVEHIREVRDRHGITVIWVEHIISALTAVVDRLIVLEQGSVIADGRPGRRVAGRAGAQELFRRAERDRLMLEVSHLAVDHGQLRALWDVSFRVAEGERVALLGANGAGKSTTLGALIGLYPAAGGTISYCGSEITGRDTTESVEDGIALVPEGRRLFPK